MNLNEIKQAVHTEPREVEFTFNGKGTGWFFTLLHASAPEVQEFNRTFQGKVRDANLKGKRNAVKALTEQHADGLREVHVKTWRWSEGDDPENGRPAFSKKELRGVLQDPQLGYHVREFIDMEVGSLEDFLAGSQTD